MAPKQYCSGWDDLSNGEYKGVYAKMLCWDVKQEQLWRHVAHAQAIMLGWVV